MDSGSILPSQLGIHADYQLTSDHDSIDQFSTSATQPIYTNEQLRRDATLPNPTPVSFGFSTTHNVRLGSDGAEHSYRPAHSFADSGPGSISTSPSSAASSLVYNNYSQNSYTGLQNYAGSVSQPPAFLPNSYTGTRVPTTLDNTASGIHPHASSFRTPLSSIITAPERNTYTHSSLYLPRDTLSPNAYGSYMDHHTPRSVLSYVPFQTPSTNYPAHMAASPTQNYNASQSESANFPWGENEVKEEIICEGVAVTPEIQAKVEKGFFLSTQDQKWTCYRRNYFSVNIYFLLNLAVTNARIFVKRLTGNNREEQLPIQAFGVKLSAAVDGAGGKSIELIQHTPKRDNGPKTKIDIVKLAPQLKTITSVTSLSPNQVYQMPGPSFYQTGAVPGPYLPHQNTMEPNAPAPSASHNAQATAGYSYGATGSNMAINGQNTNYTFERVQFKSATANNGKRRASQQYFHLVVELFADVRKEGENEPHWIKIAHKVSDKIVVRGRSPSHYQAEGQNGHGRTGNTGGGSGYNTASTYGYNHGGFRSSTGGYSGAHFGGDRQHQSKHGLHCDSDESVGSPGSAEGGALDVDILMSDAERASVQHHEGYQYYPAPMYQPGNSAAHLQLPRVEHNMRQFTTEPRQYAVKSEHPDSVPGPQWPSGGYNRFQGYDSSRGHFPNLDGSTNFG